MTPPRPPLQGYSLYTSFKELNDLSPDLQRWSIRPEAYINYPIPKKNVDNGGFFFGWGVAATVHFDVFTKKEDSSKK